MTDITQITHQPVIWILCSLTVIVVAVQAVLFVRLAKKTAGDSALDPGIAKKAFNIGLVSAIGPSCGVCIVMVGLMSAIGAPMSWMRLSVIGAAPTELAAATNGATAAGTALGGEGFTLEALIICWAVMALNGAGWLIVSSLLTPSLDKARDKIAGGDSKWLAVLSLACSMGVFSYLCANSTLGTPGMIKKGQACACLAAAVSMVLMGKFIVPKHPRFGQHALGIAMIIGIAAGLLCDVFAAMGGAV